MIDECRLLSSNLLGRQSVTKKRLDALNGLPAPMLLDLSNEVLIGAQADLVAEFNLFLDGSYLILLNEILSHGNCSNLRLSRFRASLEPKRYLPDNDYLSENDVDSMRWLTIRGVIRDIWLSYKFEPFKEKISLLFKACEFTPGQAQLALARTHVQLRNCVQHHDRKITLEALQLAGMAEFDILMDDGNYTTLTQGAEVRFTFAELERFVGAMSEISEEFYKHTAKRIRGKVWIPRKLSGPGPKQAMQG
jgi:hypothetical protein